VSSSSATYSGSQPDGRTFLCRRQLLSLRRRRNASTSARLTERPITARNASSPPGEPGPADRIVCQLADRQHRRLARVCRS
jgi:hypothetical protein